MASLHLIVEELNQQWANVCTFIGGTRQRQEIHYVGGHVSVAYHMFWEFYVKSLFFDLFCCSHKE